MEQLDDPTLRGKPVLVGPRSNRGVVLTASYEVGIFGIVRVNWVEPPNEDP